jgi:phage shock protein E
MSAFARRPSSTLVVFALLSLLASVFVESAVVQLSIDEFYQRVINKQYDVLVDVRSAEEFAAGHIEGATLVQSMDTMGTHTMLKGCESCTILIYCLSGARADIAAFILSSEGYTGIHDGGGTSEWILHGYPLVTGTYSVPIPCAESSGTPGQCKSLSAAAYVPPPVAPPVSPPVAPPVAPPVVPPPVALPVIDPISEVNLEFTFGALGSTCLAADSMGCAISGACCDGLRCFINRCIPGTDIRTPTSGSRQVIGLPNGQRRLRGAN